VYVFTVIFLYIQLYFTKLVVTKREKKRKTKLNNNIVQNWIT